MDQTVWNVAHGNGFTLTDPLGINQVSRLSIHADFLLILLAPFYFIWSNPKMLLIIQSIGLALGALPLFWLAKKVLKNRWVAAIFAIGYLLYPTIQLNALHDFHATSLSTTFFLFSFWYFVEEKPIFFVFFAILAAFGKEQFWAISGLMGIAWMFKPKYRKFGGLFALCSFVAFYLLFWVFIPSVSQGQQHWALKYLSDYGDSINGIIANMIKHPQSIITSVFASDRLFYYFQLLIPVSFLSLFSPLPLLFAAPSLGINVLTNDQLMRMIDYQYTSGITPWIFVSAIYGFGVAKRWIRPNLLTGILVATIVGSVLYWGELPVGFKTRFWNFKSEPSESGLIRQVENKVPSNVSVSATNNLGAHFSERQFIYTYPMNATSSAYVVALLGDPRSIASSQDEVHVLQLLRSDDNYEQIAHTGSFSAFKRIH